MRLERPLLIYDGDCGFCRARVERWQKLCQGRVDFAPAAEAAGNFPEIPAQNFQRSVQWIEPGGAVLQEARAVIAVLSAGSDRWRRVFALLQKIPGFLIFANAGYRMVAAIRTRLPGAGSCMAGRGNR